jgi:dCMP deaminase
MKTEETGSLGGGVVNDGPTSGGARWDQRYIQLARYIGSWSKDRSTKVGCVIVGSLNEIRAIGYNGFVRGADDDDDEKHRRPNKYVWTEHAERNAIYHAALVGISLKGCRMYLPWFPCVDCARAIVQCGIAELIAIEPDVNHERWGADFSNSIELLKEAGITVRYLPEPPQNSSVP